MTPWMIQSFIRFRGRRLLLFPVIFLSLLFTGCDSGGDGGSGGPRTVLVMGDSISGTENYPGVPPWPSLLQGDQPEWTVVNSSRAGERMEGGASRLPGQLSAHNPDQVVIFYGTNNAIHGDLATFESSLRGSIQTALAFGVDRVVVCTIPLLYGQRVIFNGNVNVINEQIRAAVSEGAALANVRGEFGEEDAAIFPDGVHPNLDGQRIIMVTVRGKL